MKTVYAIVSGFYSDYRVHFLMSDRKKAEEWVAIQNEQKAQGAYLDDYEIEEYILDPEDVFETIRAQQPIWSVYFYLNQSPPLVMYETIGAPGVSKMVNSSGGLVGVRVVLHAKDEDHAIKVANEKWMQFKAEQGL